MTPTDKPPCLPGCREYWFYNPDGSPNVMVDHALGCPNAPKEPAAPLFPEAEKMVQDAFREARIAEELREMAGKPFRPAPTPEPRESSLPTCLPDCVHTPRDWGHSESGAPTPEPEAESVDFEAVDRWANDWKNWNDQPFPLLKVAARAYLALRAEVERLNASFQSIINAASVGNKQLRAELAAERAAREKAEAERDELALLTVPSDADAEQAVRLRIAEARVVKLEDLLIVALRYAHGPIGEPRPGAIMSECGDNSWDACSRRPWHAEARAILAARSAKGGAK